MSCEAWHELLIALLDEEIEPDERARLASHLEGCGRCREDKAELEAASSALRSWEPADPRTELVFVERRRPRAMARIWGGIGRSVLLPGGVGAALAAAVTMVILNRDREPVMSALEAEIAALRERVVAAESRVPVEQVSKAAPSPEPAAVADLAPETREWLLEAVDRLVHQSESRQDAKLILAADQLARSLALQRRDDLSFVDRRFRDVQAETFEALLTTHQRLDRLVPPGERLEPR